MLIKTEYTVIFNFKNVSTSLYLQVELLLLQFFIITLKNS